jgi:hypothetical protein
MQWHCSSQLQLQDQAEFDINMKFPGMNKDVDQGCRYIWCSWFMQVWLETTIWKYICQGIVVVV